MTTPRDAISGLSERLRLISGVMRSAIAKNVPVTVWKIDLATMAEAAAKLDALQARVKELEAEVAEEEQRGDEATRRATDLARRALRAEQRVKELERENEALQDGTQSAVIVTNWFDLGRELSVPEGGSVFDTVIDLQARAPRAEQERDEAYERAAKVAETWEVNMEWVEMCRHMAPAGAARKCIAAAIRRLAVTEKEGE